MGHIQGYPERRVIAMTAYIKNTEKSQINDISTS
jgi:hypothetical protein